MPSRSTSAATARRRRRRHRPLKWQKERRDAERERLGDLWVDHDLVFARDGFKLSRGEAGGPQDPEKVSAR
ncbi:hypothetical protein ACFV0R_03580 [Streptomyces sp. NPDC059578]|uniref:hypothetical protein n=1 Tax=Streptomyces sp. NPDC059578 TaxID=3346874 RepID=UPI0036C18E5B